MRGDGKTNKQKMGDEMVLDKLSVVKTPAHAGALAAIIKSAKGDETEKNIFKQSFQEALHDIVLDDLMYEMMDKTYDLTWALRDSMWSTMRDDDIENKKEVIQNNITDFATSISSLVNNTNVIKSGGSTMTPEEIQKMIDDANAKIQKQLDGATSIIKMNTETRAHFDTLAPKGQEDFIKMTDEEKTLEIKKAATPVNDETVIMHGRTIVKSAVGADVFEVLKAQQAEIDKGKVDVQKERETRETMEFAKQAEGLYGNLPGESLAKGLALKAIHKLDKGVKETVIGMLKSGNESIELSKSFTEIGTTLTPLGDSSPTAKLNKMAEDKATADGISFTKAYDDVLRTPEGEKLYEDSLK